MPTTLRLAGRRARDTAVLRDRLIGPLVRTAIEPAGRAPVTAALHHAGRLTADRMSFAWQDDAESANRSLGFLQRD